MTITSTDPRTEKEALLAEFDTLVDRIEDAAINPTWDLADWLVENVPDPTGGQGGRPRKTATQAAVSLGDLAERRGVSQTWLRDMRATAQHFPLDARVAGVSLRAHKASWEKSKGDQDKALAALRDGGKLRDHGPAMESVTAVQRNLAARSPEERAKVVTAITDDATAKAIQETPGARKFSDRVTEAEIDHWKSTETDRAQKKADKSQEGRRRLDSILQNDEETKEEFARGDARRKVEGAITKARMALIRFNEAIEDGTMAAVFTEEERAKLASAADQIGKEWRQAGNDARDLDNLPDTVPADW